MLGNLLCCMNIQIYIKDMIYKNTNILYCRLGIRGHKKIKVVKRCSPFYTNLNEIAHEKENILDNGRKHDIHSQLPLCW